MTLHDKIEGIKDIKDKAIKLDKSTMLPNVEYNHFIFYMESVIKILDEIERDK